MSGVRNLRAMFETKEDSGTSPPDRGRSPAGSVGGGSSGTSPRPLSTVRTNFVIVERNGQLGGQWGLKKESGTDPSIAERRMSFSINEDSDKLVAERKETISSELAARKASTVISETIPETAVETPPIESEKKSGYLSENRPLGRVALASSEPSANMGKETFVKVGDLKLLPGDSTSNEVPSRVATMTNGGGIGGTLNGKTDGNAKLFNGPRSIAKSARAERSAKPGPIAASMTINTKPISKSAKSPSTPKTPTTPGRSSRAPISKLIPATSTSVSVRSVEKKASKPSLSSTGTSKPAGRPTTSSTIANASETISAHTSPSTGFHKPKPRSPTRPVKLPASLTAPTNSSLSKVTTGAVAPSRQSLAPSTKAVSRSPSRVNLKSQASNAQLRQKPSRLNENDRPALGRPSTSTVKKQPSRQSLSKEPVIADQSFLARMMRPTTSSASKTAERLVSPPRKPLNARPVARDMPPRNALLSRDGLPCKTCIPSQFGARPTLDESGTRNDKSSLFPKEVTRESGDAQVAEPNLEGEDLATFPPYGDDGTNGKPSKEEEAILVKALDVDTNDEKPTTPDVGHNKGKEVEGPEEEAGQEVETPILLTTKPEQEFEALAESAEQSHVKVVTSPVVSSIDVENPRLGAIEQKAESSQERLEVEVQEEANVSGKENEVDKEAFAAA